MAYEDTPNKALIRRQWDSSILQQWHKRIGPLTYLGLTGPEIRDLIDWRQYLDSRRTGIESIGRTKKDAEDTAAKISRIMMNLNIHDMLSGYQQLEGDAEDVIIHAADIHADPPQINDRQRVEIMRFGYDLINLDFDGGLGYKKQGHARRIEAIKRLFGRQQGHSFILLLTVNVRHTLGAEIELSLKNLQKRNYSSTWHEVIEWYISHRREDYKLKALVPSLINKEAETHGFYCTCHPPVAYTGHERAQMIHFVFELQNTGMDLPVYGQYDDFNLIDLPLVRSENGLLTVLAEQHPGFQFSKCRDLFNFLPNPLRDLVISTIPRTEND